MLIPRFSIKAVLTITAGAALLSLVQARSIAGEEWASGIMMAVAMLLSAFGAYACFFVAVLAIRHTIGRRYQTDPHSPFAGAALPTNSDGKIGAGSSNGNSVSAGPSSD